MLNEKKPITLYNYIYLIVYFITTYQYILANYLYTTVFFYLLTMFTVCQPGRFGENCRNECHCAVDGCDTITGECNNLTVGCKVPWTGRNCLTRKD